MTSPRLYKEIAFLEFRQVTILTAGDSILPALNSEPPPFRFPTPTPPPLACVGAKMSVVDEASLEVALEEMIL